MDKHSTKQTLYFPSTFLKLYELLASCSMQFLIQSFLSPLAPDDIERKNILYHPRKTAHLYISALTTQAGLSYEHL